MSRDPLSVPLLPIVDFEYYGQLSAEILCESTVRISLVEWFQEEAKRMLEKEHGISVPASAFNVSVVFDRRTSAYIFHTRGHAYKVQKVEPE